MHVDLSRYGKGCRPACERSPCSGTSPQRSHVYHVIGDCPSVRFSPAQAQKHAFVPMAGTRPRRRSGRWRAGRWPSRPAASTTSAGNSGTNFGCGHHARPPMRKTSRRPCSQGFGQYVQLSVLERDPRTRRETTYAQRRRSRSIRGRPSLPTIGRMKTGALL
jgi:hypothetical protein